MRRDGVVYCSSRHSVGLTKNHEYVTMTGVAGEIPSCYLSPNTTEKSLLMQETWWLEICLLMMGVCARNMSS